MSGNNHPSALQQLGELAVRFRMISAQQLQQALAQRDEAAADDLCGKELVTLGLISEAQRAFLNGAQEMKALRRNDIEFGKIAVERGFVSTAQIEAALQRQKEHYLKLQKKSLIGDILVASRMMSAEQRQSVDDALRRKVRAEVI